MAGNGKLKIGVVRSLACQNVVRGRDSAGLAWRGKKGSEIAKVAQHPLVAFNETLNQDIINATKSGTMLAHTRHATTGDVTNDNAHPFMIDGIAFAHNGIIANYKSICPQQYANKTFKVDSQALIYGIKKRDFSRFIGSIGLVWIEGDCLYAYRRGNPLHRGTLNDAIYLASEAQFLQRVGCHKIKELIEGTIYVFKDGKLLHTKTIPSNSVWGYSHPAVAHEHAYGGNQVVIVDGSGEPVENTGFVPRLSGPTKDRGNKPIRSMFENEVDDLFDEIQKRNGLHNNRKDFGDKDGD